jgi:hypothetical protein
MDFCVTLNARMVASRNFAWNRSGLGFESLNFRIARHSG